MPDGTQIILVIISAVLIVSGAVMGGYDSGYKDGYKKGVAAGSAEAISDIQRAAIMNYVNCLSEKCQTQRAVYDWVTAQTKDKTNVK